MMKILVNLIEPTLNINGNSKKLNHNHNFKNWNWTLNQIRRKSLNQIDSSKIKQKLFYLNQLKYMSY